MTTVRLSWKGPEAHAKVEKALDGGVDDAAWALRKRIADSFGQGQTGRWAPSPPGGPPGIDTGILSRSIVVTKHAPMRRRVGTSVFYAPIHEYGGTQWSTGKNFTIPLTPEAKLLRRRHEDLRAVKGLFVVVARGKAFLAKAKGRRGRGGLDFLFVLKKKIHVPARPFMRPAMDEMTANGELVRLVRVGMSKRLGGGIVSEQAVTR